MFNAMLKVLKLIVEGLIKFLDPDYRYDWDQFETATFSKSRTIRIQTDNGAFIACHQTMPLNVYELKTETKTLYCSSHHMVICSGYIERLVKNLISGDMLITETGLEKVVSVKPMNVKARMYDAEMDQHHLYFTDGILSHNSFGAVTYCISKCLEKPNQQVIYCAPTSKQVTGIAFKVLRSILTSCPDNLYPHKTKEELVFKNGSILMLAGCHNKGDRLRGKTADVVVIDEARDIPAEDFSYIIDSIIKPMLTTTGGQLVIVTTPPASPDHPLCIDLIPKAIMLNSFYTATYRDNPIIEPDFYRDLLDQDKGKDSTIHFRREYLADYTAADATRLICPSFDYEEQLTRFEEYTKVKSDEYRIDPWVGIDLGVRNKTAIVYGQFDQLKNVLSIIGERILSNPTTRDVIEALLDGEKQYLANKNWEKEVTRISDIDLSFINNCRKEYGINMRQVVKKDRLSMIAILDDHIRTGQTIIDVRNCPYLSAQLKGGLWNAKRTDYEASSDGSHMDAIDALKYLNMSVIRTAYNKKQHREEYFAPAAHTFVPEALKKDVLPLDQMRIGGFGGFWNK